MPPQPPSQPPARRVTTASEAAIAMLHEEIAEYLQQLEVLRLEIPKLVKEGTDDIRASVGVLLETTQGARQVIDGYGTAQEKRLADFATGEELAMRQRIRTEVREVLTGATRFAQLQVAARTHRRQILLAALAGVLVGVLAGAGAFVGARISETSHGDAGLSPQR